MAFTLGANDRVCRHTGSTCCWAVETAATIAKPACAGWKSPGGGFVMVPGRVAPQITRFGVRKPVRTPGRLCLCFSTCGVRTSLRFRPVQWNHQAKGGSVAAALQIGGSPHAKAAFR